MKKSNCQISVVIISFNGIEFIDECLSTTFESLKGIDSEVIVVDNASTDGTIGLIKSRYPQAELIQNHTNLGFARAVNQGLDVAQGRFIFLLNQDTRTINGAIPRLAERMARDERIGTIGPRFVGFDGKLQKSARAFPRYRDLFFEFTGLAYLFPESRVFSRWKMDWFDHLTEKEVDQPMGAALMIRREAIDNVGGFDESFGIFFNDVDFCRRVKESGFVNLYFPEAIVAHYVGGSTRLRKAKMIIESHRSMYKYFKKYNRSLLSQPSLYLWGGVLFATAYIRAAVSLVFGRQSPE